MSAYPLRFTVDEISQKIGGRPEGPPDAVVTGVAALEEAGPEDLVFISGEKFAPKWGSSRARVALVSRRVASKVPVREGTTLIHIEDADLALATILESIAPDPPMTEKEFQKRLSRCTFSLKASTRLFPRAARSGQLCPSKIFCDQSGGVAEWSNASVLKTEEAQVSVGSNPTPSVPRRSRLETSLWDEERSSSRRSAQRTGDRRSKAKPIPPPPFPGEAGLKPLCGMKNAVRAGGPRSGPETGGAKRSQSHPLRSPAKPA